MNDRRQLLLGLWSLGGAVLAGCSGSDGATTPADGTATETARGEDSTTDGAAESTALPTEQLFKFVSEDSARADQLGRAVAVSGDGTTAIVGSPKEDLDHGASAGSAYVLERADGGWQQQTKLVPTDGDANDRFGHSVALSDDGTTAIVGAIYDESPNGEDAGSAYVFERSNGSWAETKLVPDGGTSEAAFGVVSLSADGRTAVVGARWGADSNELAAGTAHVFQRTGGSWTEQATLAVADGDSTNDFGESVALSADGTTAVVGAPGSDGEGGWSSGAAYVFTASDGEWQRQARLTAADGGVGDELGGSVALSGDGTTAVVGAGSAGTVSVFETVDGDWVEQDRLRPADGDSAGRFGGAVATANDGTTTLVGAPRDADPNGPESGSTYVFDTSGGQQAKLTPADGAEGDRFGHAVGVADDATVALVGARFDGNANGEAVGAAYVFGDGGDGT